MLRVTGSKQLYNVMSGVNMAMAQNNKRYEEKANEGYDNACQHFYALIGACNNIAYSYMLEVMDEFEERGKLKFKAKEYSNKAADAYNKFFHNVERVFMKFDEQLEKSAYDAIFKAVPGDKKDAEEYYHTVVSRRGSRRDLWKNVIVNMYGMTEDERENLRDKMYKYMVKCEVVGDLEFMSKVALLDSLIDLAIEQYDVFFKMVAKEWSFGFDWSVAFPTGRMSDMKKWWGKAVGLMIKMPGIDFNKDYETRKAYKKMMRAEMSGARMNKASDVAISYDPELKERVERGEFDHK